MITPSVQPDQSDNQSHWHRSPVLLHVAAYLFAGVVLYRAAEVVVGQPYHMYLAAAMAVGAVFSYSLQRFERVLKVIGVVLMLGVIGGIGYLVQVRHPVLIVTMEWSMMGLILALAFTSHAPRHYATMAMATMALGIDSIRHFGAAPMAFLVPVVVLGVLLGVVLHGSAPVDMEPAVKRRTVLPWYILIFRLAAMVLVALLVGRFVSSQLPIPRIRDKSSPVHLWVTFVRSNLGLEPDFGVEGPLDPSMITSEATELRRKATLDLQMNLAQTSPDRLSRKLLFTIDSDIPVYLRTMVFDYYSGMVWGPSMKLELAPLNDGRQPYQFSLPEKLPTNKSRHEECRIWPQSDTGYHLALPVQGRTLIRGSLGRLYADPLNNIYATDHLRRGSHYACLLGEFNMQQVSGVRIGGDDIAIAEQYLQLPPVSDALIEYCQTALQGELNRLNAINRLIELVQQNKTYSLAPISLPKHVTESTEYFLFHMDRGACTQYASALAVACRIVGIPSRIVVGYGPGTYRSTAMQYEIREKDAHAWTQVWFPDAGWLDFDATPGGLSLEEQPEVAEVDERPTIEQHLDELKSDWRQWQAKGLVLWQQAATWATARKWWPVYGLGAGVVVLLLWLAGRVFAHRFVWWWRWRQSSRREPRQGVIVLYQCLLERVRRMGLEIEPTLTPSEVAGLVTAAGFPWAEDFNQITSGAERLIFGPESPSDEALAALRQQIASLRLRPAPKQEKAPAV